MSLINRLKEIQSQLQLAETVQRIDSIKMVKSMSVQIRLIMKTVKYLFHLFEGVAGIGGQRHQWNSL